MGYLKKKIMKKFFILLIILTACSFEADKINYSGLVKAIESYQEAQSQLEKEKKENQELLKTTKPNAESAKSKESLAIVNEEVKEKEVKEKEVIEEKPIEKECIPETIKENFSGGTLWKPVAEGGGATFAHNPVFLAKASYKKRFDSCEVTLKSGEKHQLTCIDDQTWTHTPYSCFANGDRQHWRFKYSCKKIKKVKITCKLDCKTIIFESKGKTCNRHE